MKNTLIAVLAAVFLTACGGGKEKTDLKEALIAKFQDDADLKDYKIDPADMAGCVLEAITDDAPGIPGDPRRTRYFEAFTRFVNAKSPADMQKAAQEYQDMFGGVKEAHAAAMSMTDHTMTCMGGAIDARPAD
jgi:hypothetical protein